MTAYERYTQVELDREYDAGGTVPSVDPYFARYQRESARVRAILAHERDVAYGIMERERLDLFPAPHPQAPLFVFIHGGYWRRLHKDYFSFVAEHLVPAGAAVATVGYELAPAVPIDLIVEEARAAIAWLEFNAIRLNADRRRIIVCGHSAGGHLAAMVAGTDWRARGIEQSPIAGVLTVSGLFDLEPVRRSYVNEWAQLDAEAAARNSPILHLPATTTPLVATVGERETSEFRRQTGDFANAWQRAGYPVREVTLVNRNHFDIMLDFLDADSLLTQAARELIAA